MNVCREEFGVWLLWKNQRDSHGKLHIKNQAVNIREIYIYKKGSHSTVHDLVVNNVYVLTIMYLLQ